MNIDIKDLITLSNDIQYVVASKINCENNTYYYLIGKEKIDDIKFCMENTEISSLIELEDAGLIQQLLPLFLKASRQAITTKDLELLASIDQEIKT